MNDPFVGSLTFTRIYSGKLTKGPRLVRGQPPMRSKMPRRKARLAWNRPVAPSCSRRPVSLLSTSEQLVNHQ
ncbi:MAG: hypothetical protein ACKO2L_15960, partial [Planctomycetaceae bacterium]